MLKQTVLGFISDHIRARFVLGYFHEKSFIMLLALMGLAAWSWVTYQYQTDQLNASSVIILITGIFVAGFLVYQLYQIDHLVATYAFLVIQVVFITAMIWLTNTPINVAWFVLVIVMAGALAGPISALVLAGLSIAVEVGLFLFAPETIGGTELPGFIIQAGMAALVSWLASFGLYDALDSAENSEQQARKHAEEAREHRAKLKRTLKSLDLVNYQLERANAELFQTREIIEAALQFKRKFAAQISHELLTSLNLILGFSETIAFAQHAYGTPLPKAYLRDVTEIHRNSKHLLTLIDDILDLSKLEAGRLGLHREPIDIGTILNEAIDIVHPLLETKGLTLQRNLAQAFPMLMMDPARIRQVLLNLLSNAARVTTQGGITVQATVDKRELIIKVKDTGPGIPAEDLTVIFQEFQQSEGLAGAAGLGLAVSQQIVSLHGGRMWAESEVGAGSTFSLAFGLNNMTVAAATGRSSGGKSASIEPAFIVLGDAEADEVKLLQRHMEGFALTPASTWEEAINLASMIEARAIIVNDVLSEVPKNLTTSVPLIFCEIPGPKQAAQQMDIAEYIRKPVTLQNLQESLKRIAPSAKHLMVVDDEPAAVRLIKRIVQASDPSYQLMSAYSGREAWRRIQHQQPDVILLDLSMPDGDGSWLISKLRQKPKLTAIPIIAVSGQIAREAYRSGPISIHSKQQFATTETLDYLRALLAATPPAAIRQGVK